MRVVANISMDMTEEEKTQLMQLTDDIEIIAWIYDHVTWMGSEREVTSKDGSITITRTDDEISNVNINSIDLIEG